MAEAAVVPEGLKEDAFILEVKAEAPMLSLIPPDKEEAFDPVLVIK